MRRLVIVLIAALIFGLCLPAPASAQATDTVAAEREFVRLINELRASKGLGQLTVDDELTSVGRGWAASMARADRISHNPDLAASVQADWQKLGENVGVGTTVQKLHAAFVASPTHYRNLVDPDFTTIGVGVVLGRDGALFTAHQFMKLRSERSAAPPPTTARTPTTTHVPAAVVSELAPGPTSPPATAPAAAAVAPARLILVLEQLRALDR